MARCIVVNHRLGVSAGRVATNAGGAPCCCGGGCCLFAPKGGPILYDCRGDVCCDWGSELILEVNGSSLVQNKSDRYGDMLVIASHAIEFRFRARYACVGESSEPQPVECLDFYARIVHTAWPNYIEETVLDCSSINALGQPEWSVWASVLIGLWSSRPDPIENRLGIQNFVYHAPCSYTKSVAKCNRYSSPGVAHRTWAPGCLNGQYASDYFRACFSGGSLHESDEMTASATFAVTVLKHCPGQSCEEIPPTCEEFLAWFVSGDPRADLNHDGFVDGMDYDMAQAEGGICGPSIGGGWRPGADSPLHRQARLLARAGVRVKVGVDRVLR